MLDPQRREIEAARGRLLPRILAPGEGPGVPYIGDQLSIGLVIEGASGAHPLEQATLERWGVSAAELMPMALENLRQRSSPANWYPLRAVPGMLVYLSGDAHAAARLMLVRELIDPWPLGGVLCSVPTPDQLLCVPLDQLEHLGAFQVLVQSGHLAHQLGREPLSDQVFWFDGDTWSHVPVRHKDDTVEVIPPPRFLQVVERLTALEMTRATAEA